MFRRGIAACDECTKNCIAAHHQEQRGPSSTVNRFFKIMHGKDYSKVLYLPPKFARDVRDLVGQKTQIEDSNGQKWTVQFSHVDGALAFHEGWRNFVEDHRLELGEILVFNYMEHGLFVVQIYGLSACEIMDFNRGRSRPNKRSRSDQETLFQDEPHQIIGIDSIHKPSSTPSILSGQDFRNCQRHPIATNTSISTSNLRKKQFPLTSKNMEDPSCILHRNSGQYQVEDRDIFFDLSNFEMEKNSSVAYKFQTHLDRSITPVETQPTEQIEVMEGDTQMYMPLTNQKNNHLSGILSDAPRAKSSSKNMPDDVSKFLAVETQNNRMCGIFGDALQAKPSGNSDSVGGMQDDASKFQAGGTNNYHSCRISGDALQAKPSGKSDSSRNMPDDVSKFQACETSFSLPLVARDTKSAYVCRGLLSESDYALNSKHCDAPVISSMLKDLFGKPASAFKKEVVELREEVYGFPRVSGIASTLGMKCGQVSSSIVKTEPDMANDFDPAVATSSFSAEVKSLSFLELPLCMPSIQRKRERGRGKVVYLKDSITRLWPVLYHGKSFVKAFTDGWKTFCKGNSIRVGDVCRFQVEKFVPCVFKVYIIRKVGQSSER